MYPLTWFLLVLTITGLASATNTVPVLNMTQYVGRWYVVSKGFYKAEVKWSTEIKLIHSIINCTGC